MFTQYDPMLVMKLERAIEELSGQAQPQGAAQRGKMVEFFHSIISECEDSVRDYDARLLAQLSRA